MEYGLTIGLVNNCNLRCPACARQNDNHIKDNAFINLLDLKNFIVIARTKYVRLVGTISEPTLYPHIIELVKYLKDNDIAILVSTNGSTHSSKFWRELGGLLDYKDEVIFAVEGSTQEIHETYRVNSNLEKVLSNHRTFKENSTCTTTLQFIKFNYNISDMPNVYKIFEENSFDKFKDIHTGPCKGSQFQPIDSFNIFAKLLENRSRDIETADIICEYSVKNMIYINHLGNVVICEYQDENIQDQIGKLNINTFKKNSQISDYLNNFQFNEHCIGLCGKFKRKLDKISNNVY